MSTRAFAAVLIACALAACGHAPPEDSRDYAQRLADDRAAKDELFRSGNDPIPDVRKAELLPLAYFPIDPDYDVPASLEPSDDQTDSRDADLRRRTAEDAQRPGRSCSR